MNRSLPLLAVTLGLASCSGSGGLPQTPAAAARQWTPAAITSPDYESTPTFSPDGRVMVFLRADPSFRVHRLYWSRCRSGGWSAPEPVPFAAPPPAIESDPGFSPDGRRLFFISTRHAPGNGDFDIFEVHWTGERWGEPRRLPAPVNSPASELLPRMNAAGTLYFGSARSGGHGKGDIYTATHAGETWTVRNVGAPVNTDSFEYEAEISRDGRTLVVVADRGDRSHLYVYEQTRGTWHLRGRVPARDDVFQVGPLLSPDARGLLFAQADGEQSGEIFLIDLKPLSKAWPPDCEARR